jgi:hypothetical protein
MPRIVRDVAPNCPHHITQRDNRREPIVCGDGDQYRHIISGTRQVTRWLARCETDLGMATWFLVRSPECEPEYRVRKTNLRRARYFISMRKALICLARDEFTHEVPTFVLTVSPS